MLAQELASVIFTEVAEEGFAVDRWFVHVRRLHGSSRSPGPFRLGLAAARMPARRWPLAGAGAAAAVAAGCAGGLAWAASILARCGAARATCARPGLCAALPATIVFAWRPGVAHAMATRGFSSPTDGVSAGAAGPCIGVGWAAGCPGAAHAMAARGTSLAAARVVGACGAGTATVTSALDARAESRASGQRAACAGSASEEGRSGAGTVG